MAAGETPVTLIGTVCSELEVRRVGERGHEMVSFWLRSNERRYDKARERWVDGRHFRVRVRCWRRLAAGVRVSVRKGDPVIVNGRLYMSGREQGREARAVPEVEALAVGPNLLRCVAPAQRAGVDEPGRGGDARKASNPSERNMLVEAAEPVPIA
ncbi:single-stranded DNA-binding protein [Amycolatopsis sp. K13G38]|uniref:Single-stranded DNA-binding protein n=1 Tax=Amycolatopsis acididurans TaxID=2724524 RepID=A0ABX1JAJ0_9PSEU|nr:single-stranded DNA-binding protein [Amycolatopsis acididurans]NKQ56802.1 single-stranded DNA-binding protein [Amycolatopsis acididurans]